MVDVDLDVAADLHDVPFSELENIDQGVLDDILRRAVPAGVPRVPVAVFNSAI